MPVPVPGSPFADGGLDLRPAEVAVEVAPGEGRQTGVADDVAAGDRADGSVLLIELEQRRDVADSGGSQGAAIVGVGMLPS